MIPSIIESPRRPTAQVTFSDGRTFEGPVGTQLLEFVRAAYPQPRAPIVGALIDGKPQELSFTIHRDCDAIPIDTTTSDGMRIYHRSVTFILVVAVHELFPEARVLVDYSVALGGFFCLVEGREPFGPPELEAIEQRMREIVAADEPITKQYIPVAEAQRMFADQGYHDKVRLLAYAERDEVPVYELRGVCDYFYGPMMARTGEITCFALEYVAPGFVLRLPRQRDPTRLTPQRDYPKLTRVFDQYGRWLRILGIDNMAALNAALEDENELCMTILVAEALHEKHISDIADGIVQHNDRVRLVLVAGPSSSGKTTFSRRLAIQLTVNEAKPLAISLDDYFKDRENTPLDEQGNYDFESLEAIDLELLNAQLLDLMAGKPVCLPHYDFGTGRMTFCEPVQPPKDAIIILEGIHGLNPALVQRLPEAAIYRIYVSALTQLNLDHHNRIPTTDTRLLRRIVRDSQFRGYQARETIARWESVRRGEERYIFPYQENADVMFNSALAYELAALKPLAEPLLLRVQPGTMEYTEAQRLLAFLEWVRPCGPKFIPANSILREFIGSLVLENLGPLRPSSSEAHLLNRGNPIVD